MRLQDDIDFTTLTWVKQELDDTLKQAQQALEAYVDDTADKSQMRFCASYLHQVQGTLRMVELYGAAMVVEEMERLALGLLDGQIKQAEDAYTVLMRGMVQLPDYLERLQSGHRDIPIVLLPLLNDLRACRGEKLLSETSLFSPDLGAALPSSAGGAKAAVAQSVMALNGGRLRLAYQFGLLKWFKGEDVDGNLTRLIAIVDRVRSMCVQVDARRLLWVAAGALEAVLIKGVDASVALKLLAGRVDRELKRLIDAGEGVFGTAPPTDLVKSLLYYVAQSKASAERVTELRQVYKLDRLMPSEAELEHARGALSGHNRALLETVGTAIKEDLLRVKDALDLYLRTGSANVDDLAPQGEALHRVADTLGMLGLGVPRRVVLDQQDVLERIVRGRQPAEESVLLDIAGSLLYVESSLDDHIERLGADQRVAPAPSSGFELPQAEVRKILDATTKEASANIQQAKQDIVAFIESPWDHSKIEQIPRLLEEISGAMRMLNLPEPAELLGGVIRFAEVELLQHRRVPSGDQLDLMADAIASIEFYLEAVKEGRRNRDKILDVTRRSLEALGYWPLPPEGGHPEAVVVTEAAPGESAPAASEFPSFNDKFTTERTSTPVSEEVSVDTVATDLVAAEAPSDAGAVAALIASFAQTEETHAAAEATWVGEAPIEVEMRSAVEIAPGAGLESLVIGESAPEALAPSVQDLDGLRISTQDQRASPAEEAAVSEDATTSLEAFEPVREETSEVGNLLDELAIEPPAELTAVDIVSPVEVAAEDLAIVIESEAAHQVEVDAPAVEVVAPAPAPAPVVSAPPPLAMPPGIKLPDGGFHSVPSDEIDDEIREVFVEEVQDELDNLNRQYPAWKNDLGDPEKLKPVRRSFHTLKGSGRLVGALAIGEYAWKIENMLNRVLDKTIQPSPAVLDLLDHAIAALPGMLAALKGEGHPDANIGTIMWVADQLAAGQEVWLPKFSPAPVVTAEEQPAAEAGADAAPVEELIGSDATVESSTEADVSEVTAADVEAVRASEAEEARSEADAQVEALLEPEAIEVGSDATVLAESDVEAGEVAAVAVAAHELAAEQVANESAVADEVAAQEQDAAAEETAEAGAEEAVEVHEDPKPEDPRDAARVEVDPATADEGVIEAVVDAQIEAGSVVTGVMLAPDAGEPSPLDVDPMLMEILSSEVDGHLSIIRAYLDAAEASGPVPVTEELLRAVHTLNGALSMVDLPVLTRVVAPLEGYLKRLRARSLEPSEEGLVALHEAAGCIAAVMVALESREQPPDTLLLAERVLALRDGLPAPDHPFHGFGIQVADEARDEEAADEDVVVAVIEPTSSPLPWYEAESESEDEVTATVELTEVFDASDDALPADVDAVAHSDELVALFGDLGTVDDEPEQAVAATSAVVEPELAVDDRGEVVQPLDEFWFDAVVGSEPAEPAEGLLGAATKPDVAEASDLLLEAAIAPEDAVAPEGTAIDAAVEQGPLASQLAESSDDLAVDLSDLWAGNADSIEVDEPSTRREDEIPFEAVIEPVSDAEILVDLGLEPHAQEHGDSEHVAISVDLGDLAEVELTSVAALDHRGLVDVDVTIPTTESAAPGFDHPSESTGLAGAVEVSEVAELFESAESAETVDAAESAEAAESADASESADAPETLDAAESVHATAFADSAEFADATEFGETAEFGDVAEFGDAAQLADSAELTEAADGADESADDLAEEPVDGSSAGISRRAARKAAKRAAKIAARIASEATSTQVPDTDLVELPALTAAEVPALATDEVPGIVTDEVPALATDEVPEIVTDDVPAAFVPEVVPAVDAAEAERGPRGPVDVDPQGALDLPDIDLDLLDIFVEEAVDILDHADGMMARLREAPGDREPVTSLQRDLHTLKGGARMAGLFPIGDLSHAMESLFEAIVHGERDASRPAIEALERAFDRLHGMVQRVRARQAIGLPEHTIARLEAILEGREDEYLASQAEADPAADAAAPVQLETSEPAVATVESSPEDAADNAEAEAAAVRKIIPARPSSRTGVQRRTQLDDDEVAARQAQQELIRVRADLLDNLVNFAGEVSIYRSRLEAQMGGFRFNLVEFEQTVLRLREQLRKLEMETEAQILSRFQRESEQSGNTEFDPLELDRFSTLQQLSRALAESVSDLVSIQNLLDDIARQSETLLLQQSRVSSDLQEGLMRTRMVPFESLVPRLRRILRQTAGELGKKAQLKVEGTQGEMDRTVLERMTAPFEHMLRNSLAHGIESPEVRQARGKPEEGTVSIRVSREATEVLIQVIDDGAGMNRDAIRRKAVERGLMTQEVHLSDRDIFQFVLEAGFSTASVVSKVAGRGVGMDVVASEVKQLGGSLELDSDPGQGTRITIRLPFTLAVAQAVMVRLGEATYAIPMSSITGVTRMPRKELDRRLEQKQLDVVYGGETYQIYDLGDLLRSPVSHGIDETQVPLLMSKTGDQRAAVRVTQVVGSKEVVVKSAGLQLSIVPGIFGATIMGDGRVVVILDLAPLVRHGVALRQAPELAAELDLLEPVPEPAVRRQPLVMVVDDSITMRKVTTRVLERSNFDVFTAKDGLDAVEQLQDRMPDVILLDIEMPRMDGYEVATYIRNDQRLKHIPIIMITSRTGEKHRQRALEVGVDRYLGKPYQEADLLKNVQDALITGHANVH